jgi:hypothetical protein
MAIPYPDEPSSLPARFTSELTAKLRAPRFSKTGRFGGPFRKSPTKDAQLASSRSAESPTRSAGTLPPATHRPPDPAAALPQSPP